MDFSVHNIDNMIIIVIVSTTKKTEMKNEYNK